MRYCRLLLIFVAVSFFDIIIDRAFAETEVSGTVADTIWTTAGSPYIVKGNLIIPENVTLGLESGVVVKFNNTHYIRVNGILDMQGTSDNPVVFTSWKDDSAGGDTNNDADTTVPSPGDWY
ncbi:MAG: hypothetical protein HOC74_18605, partial [Gemmatimonadetes bacterium]|nr:hypothetical protein [Gemmatimonadota bacterium]